MRQRFAQRVLHQFGETAQAPHGGAVLDPRLFDIGVRAAQGLDRIGIGHTHSVGVHRTDMTTASSYRWGM